MTCTNTSAPGEVGHRRVAAREPWTGPAAGSRAGGSLRFASANRLVDGKHELEDRAAGAG